MRDLLIIAASLAAFLVLLFVPTPKRDRAGVPDLT